MPGHWAAIDALVQDIGELSAEVQLAERTLSTDARTRAARRALDRATDAVCEGPRTLRTAKEELPRLAALRQRWRRILSKE